jgi:hypothetical protein
MLSGGSTESLSLIPLASTVTVQLVPSGRLAVGSSVKLEPGVPESENVFELPPQTSVKDAAVALTDSLKLTVTFVSVPTFVAESAGEVLVTVGAASAVVKLNT